MNTHKTYDNNLFTLCGPFALSEFPFRGRHVITWSTSLLQFNKPQNRRIFEDLVVYILFH